MTLVVGLKCADGLVLGADSQESYASGFKGERNKLLVSRSIGPVDVVIGLAGMAPLCDQVTPLLVDAVRKVKTPSRVAIQTALIWTLSSFHEGKLFKNFVANEEDRYIGGLIAMRRADNGDLYLWQVNSTAVLPVDDCALVGEYSPLCERIVKQGYRASMSVTQGAAHVVNAISAAKFSSLYVGGPIRLVTLDRADVHEHSQPRVDAAERRATAMLDAAAAGLWELADPDITQDEYARRGQTFMNSMTAARGFYGKDGWSWLDEPLKKDDDDL